MSKEKNLISSAKISVTSENLSEELWLLISQYVDLNTLQQLGLLNKKHRRINNTNSLWKPYLKAIVPTKTEEYRKIFMQHPEYVDREALPLHPIHQFLLKIAQQEDQNKAAKDLTEKACHSAIVLRTLVYSKLLFQTIINSSDSALFLKRIFDTHLPKSNHVFFNGYQYHEVVELMVRGLNTKYTGLLFLEELLLMQLPEKKYKVVHQFLSSENLQHLFEITPILSEAQIAEMTTNHSDVKERLLKEAGISSSHALSLLNIGVSRDIIIANITFFNPILVKYVEAALFVLISFMPSIPVVLSYYEAWSVLETVCRAYGFEEMHQHLLANQDYHSIALEPVCYVLVRQILNRYIMQDDIPHPDRKIELSIHHEVLSLTT